MAEMTGTCMYCGQTRIILDARDQEQADLIATRECGACDNPVKRNYQVSNNIEELCGESAPNYGMQQLPEELIDLMKDVGSCIIEGTVGSISINVKDSVISIKKSGLGASVTRKKVISAKLEA